jgi:hypothetical protein
MPDLSEMSVFDSIVRAYDTDPANYRNERYGQGVVEVMYGAGGLAMPEGHEITAGSQMRDWIVEGSD